MSKRWRALAGFNGEYRLVVEREQHLTACGAEASAPTPARTPMANWRRNWRASWRHRRVGRSGGAGARHRRRATHKANGWKTAASRW